MDFKKQNIGDMTNHSQEIKQSLKMAIKGELQAIKSEAEAEFLMPMSEILLDSLGDTQISRNNRKIFLSGVYKGLLKSLEQIEL